jgi:glycosyltransferase involved in cell wall biosynthesis
VVFLGGIEPGDPYGAEFSDLVRARPWCEYVGFTDRARLKAGMARASSLVLPSHEDNCPMVVLEAMAAGVSVAAGRVGGVPELIADGETGLMFDPASAEEMRGAVARLLEDEATDKKLVARARDEALRRFLPRVVARRHVEIYQEVLSRKT